MISRPPQDSDYDCDVAIIGGGPTGSTAGTVLAREGLSATIFEREKFPRFHVGESLLPFNRDLLTRLGLDDKVDQFGWIRKYGAFFVTNDGGLQHQFDFDEYFPSPHDHAWEVERAEFDELLLRHAEECGAAVREEHHIRSIDFSGAGAVLTVVGPDNNEFEWRARWVIDGSGQASFLAKKFNMRETIPGMKKVALYSHYRGAQRREGKHEGHITLTFGERRWFWSIPLRNELTSVGCVIDRDRWKSGTAEDMLDQCIESSPYLSKTLDGAERVRQVHTASAFSFQCSRYAGPGWVLAGDSAAFIDPIFSTGVQLGMVSGELAAQVLAKRIKAGRPLTVDMFRSYERRLRKWTNTCFKVIRAYYHPKFQPLFFSPRQRPVKHMAPFFAGKFDLGVRSRFFFGVFFFLLKVLERRQIIEDPRPEGATTHHG